MRGGERLRVGTNKRRTAEKRGDRGEGVQRGGSTEGREYRGREYYKGTVGILKRQKRR